MPSAILNTLALTAAIASGLSLDTAARAPSTEPEQIDEVQLSQFVSYCPKGMKRRSDGYFGCVKDEYYRHRVATNCEMISRMGWIKNRNDFYVYTIGWESGTFQSEDYMTMEECKRARCAHCAREPLAVCGDIPGRNEGEGATAYC